MKESSYLSMIRKTVKGDGDLERRRTSRAFAEGSENVCKHEESDGTVERNGFKGFRNVFRKR